MDKFQKTTSIKTKILMPFLIMISILAISMLCLSLYLISKNMTQQLTAEFINRSHVMNHYIRNQIQTPVNQLTRFIANPELKGKKSTIETLLKNNTLLNTKIIWDTKKIPKNERTTYESLLNSKTPKGSNAFIMIHPNSKIPTIVNKIKNKSQLILLEQTLSDKVLQEIYSQFQLNTALLYKNKKTKSQLIGATKDIANQTLFKLFLENISPLDQSRLIKNVKINKVPYNIIIQQLQSFPELYTVTIVPLKSVMIIIQKLIIGSILFLLIMGCILFGTYTIIIQKITSSIDILSEVAKKITLGDLEQHVYNKTHDEIGELSHLFNEMVVTLKESSDRLVSEHRQSQTIISHIPAGLIATDIHNNLILANKKAEEIFNFSNKKNEGKFLLNFINEESLLMLLNDTIQKHKKTNYREIQILHKNKKKQVFGLVSSYIPDQQKSKSKVITIIRDITHEKELDALRDGFLTTVSHELRTPLTSIIGFIEIVKNSALEEEQKQHLQIALDETLSLKTMINDLLDLSRIQAGQIDLFFSKINIRDCFEQLIQRLHPIAQGKNLELKAKEIDRDIVIDADENKLKRILGNLITNAIKFTEKGSITLSCRKTTSAITIDIEDTGIGLIESEKELIFEKFRQVDDSSTRKFDGIGLGLSIVKQLITMHKGTIKVTSIYGKGSMFTITLPIKNTHRKKTTSTSNHKAIPLPV